MRHLQLKSILKSGEHFHISKNRMTKNSTYPVHTHTFYEIFLIEEGIGIHRINGKRLQLAPGSLVMIRPRDVHGFSVIDTKGFVVSNLAFFAKTLEFLKQRYFAKEKSFFGGTATFPRSIQAPEHVRSWIAASFEELANGQRSRLALERFLLDLFCRLRVEKPAASDSCPQWLTNAIARCNSPECFKKGTVGFARLCGHGPEHVCRVTKKALGKTPTDLVNHARLSWAAGQLSLTPRKISTIAFDCGFESAGHFFRIFKNAYGITPRLYRARNSAVYK
jgi:AraC family transcriptional regulator, dual regulator of chb operon